MLPPIVYKEGTVLWRRVYCVLREEGRVGRGGRGRRRVHEQWANEKETRKPLRVPPSPPRRKIGLSSFSDALCTPLFWATVRLCVRRACSLQAPSWPKAACLRDELSVLARCGDALERRRAVCSGAPTRLEADAGDAAAAAAPVRPSFRHAAARVVGGRGEGGAQPPHRLPWPRPARAAARRHTLRQAAPARQVRDRVCRRMCARAAAAATFARGCARSRRAPGEI